MRLHARLMPAFVLLLCAAAPAMAQRFLEHRLVGTQHRHFPLALHRLDRLAERGAGVEHGLRAGADAVLGERGDALFERRREIALAVAVAGKRIVEQVDQLGFGPVAAERVLDRRDRHFHGMDKRDASPHEPSISA